MPTGKFHGKENINFEKSLEKKLAANLILFCLFCFLNEGKIDDFESTFNKNWRSVAVLALARKIMAFKKELLSQCEHGQ